MIIFCDGRSLAVTKEVLPPRKSLRLQNKEAEILALPPEPKDTPNSREVADMTHHASLHGSLLLPGSFCCCCCCCLVVFLTFVYSFKPFPAKKPPGPLPMDPINMEEGSKLPSQLLKLCSEVGLALNAVMSSLHYE